MCPGIINHHRFWETDSGASPGDLGMGMGMGMCGCSKAMSADAKWVSLCPGEHTMHKEGWTEPHQHPQLPTCGSWEHALCDTGWDLVVPSGLVSQYFSGQ